MPYMLKIAVYIIISIIFFLLQLLLFYVIIQDLRKQSKNTQSNTANSTPKSFTNTRNRSSKVRYLKSHY